MIIIRFSRYKGLVICLCTRLEENLKISSSLELWLVRFEEREDEDEESVVYLYFVPCMIFSHTFLHVVPF